MNRRDVIRNQGLAEEAIVMHYCHACALALGIVGNGPSSNLTGTQYQVDKFLKHTIPTLLRGRAGVFDDPSFKAYEGYVVNSALSGSVEVDDSGRTNIVWYAGKRIGATWKNGMPVLPNDTVKLVMSHDSGKVHAFSVTSVSYGGQTCNNCGGPVLP